MRLALIVASGLTIAAALAPTQPDAAASPEVNLTGLYACEGTGPDGMPYRGIVEIARNNGAYQLVWTFSPDEQYLGIGIMSGEMLAVSYFGVIPGAINPVRIESGASGPLLTGNWTLIGGQGQLFSETLRRLAPGTPGTPGRPGKDERPARPTPPPRVRPSLGTLTA